MKIGELFVQLGFKTDKETLRKFNQGINNLKKDVLTLQVAFAGAIFGLDRFVKGTLEGVVALTNLNRQTGLSIRELQKWRQAGQLANLNLNAEEISNSIAKLQDNLAQIRRGRGNVAPFQLLGIDIAGKDAFQVLESIRGAIVGVSDAQATSLIKKLGLDSRFINILRLTREEFEKLGKNIFLTPAQQRSILKVGQSFKMLTLRLKALKDQAVAKISPQLEKLIKNFFMWIDKNGTKIINTISGLARVFGTFAEAVGNAFSLITQMLERVFGLENGIKALALAFGVLSLSFSPFLAGLILIIGFLDDIRVWIEGGDALFGKFYDFLDGLISRFDGLTETFNKIGETSFFKKLFTRATAGGVIGSVIPGVGTLTGAGIGALGGIIKDAITSAFENKRLKSENNFEVNVITGSGDAREIAVMTIEELKNAQSQLNNGGI